MVAMPSAALERGVRNSPPHDSLRRVVSQSNLTIVSRLDDLLGPGELLGAAKQVHWSNEQDSAQTKREMTLMVHSSKIYFPERLFFVLHVDGKIDIDSVVVASFASGMGFMKPWKRK